MAQLSLADAARLVGKSKSTLTRAVKSGKMSAIRQADGTFSIDPSELARAYPDAVRGASYDAPCTDASDAVTRDAQRSEINALRDELASARQRAAVAEALADERARALEASERNLSDLRRLLPGSAGVVPSRPWWRFWS